MAAILEKLLGGKGPEKPPQGPRIVEFSEADPEEIARITGGRVSRDGHGKIHNITWPQFLSSISTQDWGSNNIPHYVLVGKPEGVAAMPWTDVRVWGGSMVAIGEEEVSFVMTLQGKDENVVTGVKISKEEGIEYFSKPLNRVDPLIQQAAQRATGLQQGQRRK